MSAQLPVNPDSTELDMDDRAARRTARRHRRAESGPAWLGGVVLIALGLIFLLQNTGALSLENWWALFIFIPAVASFGAAWNRYRDAGDRMTGDALSSLIGGLIFSLIALALLFNFSLGIDWALWWPVLLILGGGAILVKLLWR